MNLSASLLQAHLRRLVEFGVVTQDTPGSRADHRKRLYRTNKKDVDKLLNALESTFRQ